MSGVKARVARENKVVVDNGNAREGGPEESYGALHCECDHDGFGSEACVVAPKTTIMAKHGLAVRRMLP